MEIQTLILTEMNKQISKSGLAQIASQMGFDAKEITSVINGGSFAIYNGSLENLKKYSYVRNSQYGDIVISQVNGFVNIKIVSTANCKMETYTIKDTRSIEEVCKSILNKNGQLSEYDREAVNAMNTESYKFYGKEVIGRGRYIKIRNVVHKRIKHILIMLNVEFSEGNDAPRGGKTGDYIIIDNKRERARFAKFLNYLKTK